MNESTDTTTKIENTIRKGNQLMRLSKYGENGEKMVIEFDHSLYIPFLLFIFTLPIIVITILCILRQRNRRLVSREIEKINNRRFSTTSALYNGTTQSIRNNVSYRYSSICDKQKISNSTENGNSVIEIPNKRICKIKDINKSKRVITIKGSIDL
uniref:Uncharacterized protein n=1 Tax=Strongyloides papillosus TaxID=174720 RepID=A0A0N5BRX5_STREA